MLVLVYLGFLGGVFLFTYLTPPLTLSRSSMEISRNPFSASLKLKRSRGRSDCACLPLSSVLLFLLKILICLLLPESFGIMRVLLSSDLTYNYTMKNRKWLLILKYNLFFTNEAPVRGGAYCISSDSPPFFKNSRRSCLFLSKSVSKCQPPTLLIV